MARPKKPLTVTTQLDNRAVFVADAILPLTGPRPKDPEPDCSDCRSWHAFAEGLGECRAWPPQVPSARDLTHRGPVCGYTVTKSTTPACGLFQSK